MEVVLDSSILIPAERGRFDLPAFFATRASDAFFFAEITASELLHGVERPDTPERLKWSNYVEGVLQQLPIIDFDLSVARRHARVWAALEKSGKLIGPHDMLIAATALECGHALATLNRDEFENVKGIDFVGVNAFLITKL